MTRADRKLLTDYLLDSDFRREKVRVSRDGNVHVLLSKLAGSGRGFHPLRGKWVLEGSVEHLLAHARLAK